MDIQHLKVTKRSGDQNKISFIEKRNKKQKTLHITELTASHHDNDSRRDVLKRKDIIDRGHISDNNDSIVSTNDKKAYNESDNEKNDDNESDDDDTSNKKSHDNAKYIVILDRATMETVKTKKGEFELLNCDDHINIMRKNNKDPQNFRPDILHQELMAVLDSPLNKAGYVKVFIHTEKNVLIEVNPKTRIPRTFKRFSGLMVQLLHRLKIRSADGKDVLLKVIKNPISRHLPAGCRCYGFSVGGNLISPSSFVEKISLTQPTVFIFGAMATGSISKNDHPYIEELVSISQYPLSGVVAINRVMGAVEHLNNIV